MNNAVSVTKKQRSGKKTRPAKANVRQDNVQQTRMQQGRTQQEKPATATADSRTKSVLGIELNAKTARSAIILSEIIGPPVSRRQRRR